MNSTFSNDNPMHVELINVLGTMKEVSIRNSERQVAIETQLSAHQNMTQEALTKLTQAVDRQTENITHLLEQNARHEEKFIRLNDLDECVIDLRKRVTDTEGRISKLEHTNESNDTRQREMIEAKRRWVDVMMRFIAPTVTLMIAGVSAVYVISGIINQGV